MEIPEHPEFKKRPETYLADDLHAYYKRNPDVIKYKRKRKRAILPDGKRARISMPLYTFIVKGTTCVSCGIKGTVYQAYDSKKQNYIKLNLFAQKEDGSWVLMTADHTIPRSAGGGNFIHNLEPMCMECNYTKGSSLPDNFNPEELTISLKSVKDRIITANRGHEDLGRYLRFHGQLMKKRHLKGATIPGIVSKKYAKAYIKLVERPYNLTMPKSFKKMGLID